MATKASFTFLRDLQIYFFRVIDCFWILVIHFRATGPGFNCQVYEILRFFFVAKELHCIALFVRLQICVSILSAGGQMWCCSVFLRTVALPALWSNSCFIWLLHNGIHYFLSSLVCLVFCSFLWSPLRVLPEAPSAFETLLNSSLTKVRLSSTVAFLHSFVVIASEA